MSGIMPMVNVPDMVQYGRVQAHLVAFIADTLDDGDQIPDEIPLEGVVVLTPTVGVVRFPTTVPPRTAVVQALRCPVIAGDLYPPDTPLEGPLPAQPGVVVVASDQPVGLPDTVQWTATFELVGARVQPSSVTFEVPSGGVVDLTTVIPATPTPGTVVVVSTESRDRAEAAAATATQKATDAAASATAAATSATNAASSATAAQTAAATLRDTGWRNVSKSLHANATGSLLVRRIGSTVTARMRLKSTVEDRYMRIWQMPVGWQPRPWVPIGFVPYGTAEVSYVPKAVGPILWEMLLHALSPTPLNLTYELIGELSWLTNDDFPSPAAYPGTPA